MNQNKLHLEHMGVLNLAQLMADKIETLRSKPNTFVKVFPIPRGGVPVAYALSKKCHSVIIVSKPEEADFFVDDIIDTGFTMKKWCDEYPGKPFLALIDKTDPESLYRDDWVVFPWETSFEKSSDDSIVGTITNRIKTIGSAFKANDNISAFVRPEELDLLQIELTHRAKHFLRGLVIDLDNDHNTQETAERMAKMYLREVLRGRYEPAPKVTDFPNAKNLDEMYVTGPITIRSACSHHFAPIIGKCWIGIVPGERVIGLSKFNRIVEWFAGRGQIQEELVVQIADYLMKLTEPKGLAVVIEATHMCMTWRGVRETSDAAMTTSVMRGSFRDKPEARAEFMALIKKG